MKTVQATAQERRDKDIASLIQPSGAGYWKVWSQSQGCYIYTTSYTEAQGLAERLLSEVGFSV